MFCHADNSQITIYQIDKTWIHKVKNVSFALVHSC
jgi:hypothetical protein